MGMRSLKWAATIVVALLLGYGTAQKRPLWLLTQKTGPSPFSISVVPAWSHEPDGRGISMATNTLDRFYVILTNASGEAQAAFLPFNSWGYYAVSFELQTLHGEKITISKEPQLFTKNIPSIFVIPPGEHMVYPIRLDDEWSATAAPPMADETSIPITIKAVYKVDPTPESARQGVWSGRSESPSYHFYFRHWE